MTDCDPTIEECPVAVDTSLADGDFGEYVEDGYGQRSDSSLHLLHVTLFGFFGWGVFIWPWVVLLVKPEWVLGLTSFDLLSILTLVVNAVIAAFTTGDFMLLIAKGFYLAAWAVALFIPVITMFLLLIWWPLFAYIPTGFFVSGMWVATLMWAV